jgi:hypothetical protein
MPKPFVKNDPRINKTGRPKGAPNKTTEEIRGVFQSFLEANLDKLQTDFDQLEPKDRLSFIERVAKMILPPPVDPLEAMTDEQLKQLHDRLIETYKTKVA